MAEGQRRFTESEANEILRTAVRTAAPDKIRRDELAIVAAQLGIDEEALRAAEEKHERLKTEAGERKEFHAMQRRTFLGWLPYPVGYVVIALLATWPTHSWLGWFVGLLSCFMIPILAAIAYQATQILSPRSAKYRQDFGDWKYFRQLQVNPDLRIGLVDNVIGKEFAGTEPVSRNSLRRAIQRTLRCDSPRASDAIEAYVAQHPELQSRLQ